MTDFAAILDRALDEALPPEKWPAARKLLAKNKEYRTAKLLASQSSEIVTLWRLRSAVNDVTQKEN